MAKAGEIGAVLEKTPELKGGFTLKNLLSTKNVRDRFEDVLGKKAAGFISSLLTLQTLSKGLQTANPASIVAAAAVAASLDLPINPNLGFAYIIPYKDVAQFQMGYKGFIQLAMRSGQYRTLNVTEVYEGQVVKIDPFTGLMEFNAEAKTSEKIVGYVAYERLLNGFEKYFYMSKDQVTAHGKKYSQTFAKGTGKWTTDFDAMAKKTVLKLLLSKFGILSIEMQKAVTFDQAVVSETDQPEYLDGSDVFDAPAETTEAQAAP